MAWQRKLFGKGGATGACFSDTAGQWELADTGRRYRRLQLRLAAKLAMPFQQLYTSPPTGLFYIGGRTT